MRHISNCVTQGSYIIPNIILLTQSFLDYVFRSNLDGKVGVATVGVAVDLAQLYSRKRRQGEIF